MQFRSLKYILEYSIKYPLVSAELFADFKTYVALITVLPS